MFCHFHSEQWVQSPNRSQREQLPDEPDGMTLPEGTGWAPRRFLLPEFPLWMHRRAGRAGMKEPPFKQEPFQEGRRTHPSSRWMEPVVTAKRGSRIGQNRAEAGQLPARSQVLGQPQGGCGESKGTWGTLLNPAKAQAPHFCFSIFPSEARILQGKNQGSKWTWL